LLFNSYEFIFLFLPLTLLVFFLIGARAHHRLSVAWLVGMSLFFYGWWNPVYLGLILFSMLFNYSMGAVLCGRHANKLQLAFGITVNLGLLAYFKYANFFVENLNAFLGFSIHLEHIILPLAISFFTFQQIAYLVDAYRKETKEYNFLHYCLFVTFFPQLIAGPIVHHKEMMPQFGRDSTFRFNPKSMELGITMFGMGLFKKVILADGIATYATPIFDAAAGGSVLTFLDAWIGTLAYTFQLYFDFSAYSDMAIGIGLMFGVRLPVNFNSPYKAVNIIDFWRRWHMTLSRFLRDYIYIPLGGNRKGTTRRYINLMSTMLIGGLWHGAGWTFVLWGGLHGLYLAINHFWHALRRRLGHDLHRSTLLGRMASGTLTFLAVTVAWVFFRAEHFSAATGMLSSMFTPHQAQLLTSHMFKSDELPFIAIWFVSLALIVWVMPNLQQWMRYLPNPEAKYPMGSGRLSALIEFQPTATWALFDSILTGTAILGLTKLSEFLYFQF
jgi:D-alanyl-lipoteichoic acid acyltransferase DltB (MBOAT superfamily)